jgi:hypothetical protein
MADPRVGGFMVDEQTVAPDLSAVRVDESFAECIRSVFGGSVRTAPAPIRPLPVARLTSPTREASTYYTVTTIDDRGRLADGSPLRILQWEPGLTIALLVLPGAVVAAAHRSGQITVTHRRQLRLPAALRHSMRLEPGARLLMAADLHRDLLVVYTMTAVEAMVSEYNASLDAGHPA